MTKGMRASDLRPIENPKDYLDLRRRMINAIEEVDPKRTATLALSGGVDSATMLFAMLESGRKPRCYTFYTEGVVSHDLQSARNLARYFDLELIECEMPCSVERVYDDCKTLVTRAAIIKKTVIQCMHPWLYLCPAMQERGDKLILTGLGADDLYCTQRKVFVMWRKHGDQAILDMGWRGLYDTDLNFSTGNIIAMAKNYYGITVEDVYSRRDIHSWFVQFGIGDLHKPFQKAPSVFAFHDYYKKGSFYRERDPYQIGSGLRDLHDAMLLREDMNVHKHKAVIGIYNRLYYENS